MHFRRNLVARNTILNEPESLVTVFRWNFEFLKFLVTVISVVVYLVGISVTVYLIGFR